MASGDTRSARLTATTALLVALASTDVANAQQGNVRVTASAQAVAADPVRRAGQNVLEPDFGLTVYQPGFRFGTLFADIHAVRRGDRAHVGQSSLGLRDVKLAGLVWSVTAGDNSVAPTLADYRFTNLSAPQVSFTGASVSAFSPRVAITATAGHTTALRNIFGSDPQTLGQEVREARASIRPGERVELLGRASRVRTRDAAEFSYPMDEGDDLGAGTRVRLTPSLELSADGGMSWYRRRGSMRKEQSPTGLAGLQWAAPRGWVQINAQRFAPGYFAVLNTPYLDRMGAFAAAEYELFPRLRVFGGFEASRTNLDPAASVEAAGQLPRGAAERGYAGVRLHAGGRSFLTFRAEDGDRTARPIRQSGAELDSDTGVVSADVQTGTAAVSAFLRYERREYQEQGRGLGGYTQHTSTAQLFARIGGAAHAFGKGMVMRREQHAGGGQTFWQAGAGFQWKLPRRQLWLRGEGQYSRSDEWPADLSLPRRLFSGGLSGQLTSRTAIAFDVAAERTPFRGRSGSPWLTRTMLRVMHTFPTGSARVSTARGTAVTRSRGSGSLIGLAFADWNANGTQDAGEGALAGVPFVLGPPIASRGDRPQVRTGPDGHFAFVGVPLGRANVSLDLSALPVDFDPPQEATRETEVRRRGGERLAFGLIPLGTISGAVRHDQNGDGKADETDPPLDRVIVSLDGGARSERTSGGAFRFDAVRPGVHTLALLAGSLPDGATVTGGGTMTVEMDRDRQQIEVVFLLKLEKRREIRRVFPPVQGRADRPDPPAGPTGHPAAAAAVTASRHGEHEPHGHEVGPGRRGVQRKGDLPPAGAAADPARGHASGGEVARSPLPVERQHRAGARRPARPFYRPERFDGQHYFAAMPRARRRLVLERRGGGLPVRHHAEHQRVARDLQRAFCTHVRSHDDLLHGVARRSRCSGSRQKQNQRQAEARAPPGKRRRHVRPTSQIRAKHTERPPRRTSRDNLFVLGRLQPSARRFQDPGRGKMVCFCGRKRTRRAHTPSPR